MDFPKGIPPNVTGGVNTYDIYMDYGDILVCDDDYSRGYYGQRIGNVGERPLAEGEFMIWQQGKKLSEQRNFTRLPNLTDVGNRQFKGYGVAHQNEAFSSSSVEDISSCLGGESSNTYYKYEKGQRIFYLFSLWDSFLT